MHARHLLLNRSSMPSLTEPAPTPVDLEIFEAAALRVPDHKHLVPFRLISFQKDEQNVLGTIFQRAAEKENMGETAVARAQELPLRAPLLIAVVTQYKLDQGIPKVEQFATAACAAHAVVQAAFVQGYGAIWRTGPYAESKEVKAQLKCSDEDIVGFIYLGTPTTNIPTKPAKQHQVLSTAADFLNL